MATAPITDSQTRDDYTASAGQTTFPYTFWIKEEDHLDVYVNGILQTLTADYTVSATQDVSGANVVFSSGLTLNDKVSIVYNPDVERLTEFSTSGPLKASTLNLELSYLTSLLQYLDTLQDRNLRLAPSDQSFVSLELPSPAANNVIAYNSSANALTAFGFSDFPTDLDVFTDGIADGEILQYDSVDSRFENVTAASAGIMTLVDNQTISGDKTFTGAVDLTGATLTLAAGEIDTADLADVSVTTAKIADANVTTAKIADDAVTAAKMNNVAYNKNFLHVQDQKPSGTDGGSPVSGDNTRDLNTVLKNTITGASLSSDQITLPVGTYYIKASAPTIYADRHRVFLYNTSDSSVEMLGLNAFASNADRGGSHSFVEGQFTIATSKTFELRHYIQTSRVTEGLGVSENNSRTEIYADVKIWKVS